MLPKRVFKIMGLSFLAIGAIVLLNSFQGLTGFVIFEGADVNYGWFVALWFLLGGIVLLMAKKHHKITSRIKDYGGLVRLAKESVKDQSVQKEINHLTEELYEGNANPGIGTRNLFGNISYLRGRNGGRVFYRPKPGGYEILAKASKDTEDRVIDRLHDIYDTKGKKKTG
jgi:hypothetical protein